jgi:predicted dehydrogenase
MKDLSVGIVGISDGNGHPYSFASIINGYDNKGFERSDWGVIHDYLREKDQSEFGFPGVQVTHAWTQNTEQTEILCDAARIPNLTQELDTLYEAVDALIIARDDPESHARIALPALESGLPVFVDKPLTTNRTDLAEFKPYLQSGQLMSCSGMRYATELDEVRGPTDHGELQFATGVTVKNWKRYGPHLIDALFGAVDVHAEAVRPIPSPHDSFTVELSNNASVRFDAVGDGPFSLDLSLYTTHNKFTVLLRDNFTAFRRTLYHFFNQIRNESPAIPPEKTINVIKTIIAGMEAKRSGERISIAGNK